jgi:Flp pilus assembly secretin CpaC
MSHTDTRPAAAAAAAPRPKLARAVLGALLLAGAGTTAATFAQERPADAPASATAPARVTQRRHGRQPTRATDVVAGGLNEQGKLSLMVNKSQVVTTKLPYKTVNVANPETADVNRVNDHEILITARSRATRSSSCGTSDGLSQTVDVTVMSDLEAPAGAARQDVPGAGIQATNVNGTIALRGPGEEPRRRRPGRRRSPRRTRTRC